MKFSKTKTFLISRNSPETFLGNVRYLLLGAGGGGGVRQRASVKFSKSVEMGGR